MCNLHRKGEAGACSSTLPSGIADLFYPAGAGLHHAHGRRGSTRRISLSASSRPGSVQHVTHSLFRTLRLAVWGVTIIRVPFPQFDAQIGVFPALMQPAIVLSGLVLLLLASPCARMCTITWLSDWRTGVDERAETNLITSGPFSRLRHPMFLGVVISQLGLFFSMPSVFSLICLVAGIVAVIAQARFEEKELARRFGEPYLAYLALTRAGFPARALEPCFNAPSSRETEPLRLKVLFRPSGHRQLVARAPLGQEPSLDRLHLHACAA